MLAAFIAEERNERVLDARRGDCGICKGNAVRLQDGSQLRNPQRCIVDDGVNAGADQMFDWYKGMVDESTGHLLYLYDPESDITVADGDLIRDMRPFGMSKY